MVLIVLSPAVEVSQSPTLRPGCGNDGTADSIGASDERDEVIVESVASTLRADGAWMTEAKMQVEMR
jgi:hypothetical protein